MPGLHVAVLELARDAGIPLEPGVALPWLSRRGHTDDFVQRRTPAHVVAVLSEIHLELGGNATVLASKTAGSHPIPDLVHSGLGCVIEVDELQHFTSSRLRSLERYPADARLGFDLVEYRELIERWRHKADRAFAHKVSRDFPNEGGRQAQRAYNDALRDLLAPTFTGHPVVRLPVPDRSLDCVLDRLRAALARFD